MSARFVRPRWAILLLVLATLLSACGSSTTTSVETEDVMPSPDKHMDPDMEVQ